MLNKEDCIMINLTAAHTVSWSTCVSVCVGTCTSMSVFNVWGDTDAPSHCQSSTQFGSHIDMCHVDTVHNLLIAQSCTHMLLYINISYSCT